MSAWFRNDLREKRNKAGWSLAKVANETGIPLRTLESWEGGLRTPPDYVANLVLHRLDELIKAESEAEPSYTWYRLVQTTFYFNKLKDIKPGASLDDEDGKVLKLFKNKEEAFKELDKCTSDVIIDRTFYGSRFEFTEWSIEEYTGDENGEFIEGSDLQPCKMFDEAIHIQGSGYYKFIDDEWVCIDNDDEIDCD